MYQLLAYVKYCQSIILTFIAGLLWVMGLWTMGVMPDNGILPPLPHQSQDQEIEERFQQQGDLIQNPMQSQQYIISTMQVTMLKYAIFPITNIA
jgi:hypothetical protein